MPLSPRCVENGRPECRPFVEHAVAVQRVHRHILLNLINVKQPAAEHTETKRGRREQILISCEIG